MSGKTALFLLVFPLFLSFQGDKPSSPATESIKIYSQAALLYYDVNATESVYPVALKLFDKFLDLTEKNVPDRRLDSLRFEAYVKKGVLLDMMRKNDAACVAYCSAIQIQKKSSQLSDSLAFLAYSYAGSSYYNQNNFDSSNYFLQGAQNLIERFPNLAGKEDVYNTLGVLYYDNGNYIQSKNYFNKALDLIRGRTPLDTGYAAGIETNMATSLYRLGDYQEALTIYHQVERFHRFGNFVYMNMGRANAALDHFKEALAFFRKVNPAIIPGVLNEMAYAQFKLQNTDSAMIYLDHFVQLQHKGKVNKLDLAINDLYRSDLQMAKTDYHAALTNLQRAICTFSGHFSDMNISANPSRFTGTIAYYWLFESLVRKAQALGSLYQADKNESWLVQSFATYESVLSLLAYIEKSYDTDDAKLFLKKKSWEVYPKALETCLYLHRLHPGEQYLEKAFLISEKNKASVVMANLHEKNLAALTGVDDQWVKAERNIKYNIARLNVNSDQSQDSTTVENNAKAKSQYEIELAELQKKIEQNSHYYKSKYSDNYPTIPELQNQIGGKQALISFYFAGGSLHAFVLTRSAFRYKAIDSVNILIPALENWLTMLKTPESGRKFSGTKTGLFLYDHLIKPVQEMIPEKDEWIIIPDGPLCFLPFESLPADHQGTLMLEKAAISYQFSSRLMVSKTNTLSNENNPESVLAFAPFAAAGANLDGQHADFVEQLPASQAEISGLKGKQVMNQAATKMAFLESINQYPIVHLATHAVSDIQNSAASYVAFYPEKKSKADNCLYLEELYGLNMDATRLMIISACETGKGELISNEGVISIARAFTYAGCGSVLNSLWKADDQATSMILRKFHQYLQEGLSKSKSLQLAKLDYIKSNAVYKSPEYWSDLVLIGNIEPLYKKKQPYGWAALFAGTLSTLWLLWMKKRKKSRRFSRTGILNKIENVV